MSLKQCVLPKNAANSLYEIKKETKTKSIKNSVQLSNFIRLFSQCCFCHDSQNIQQLFAKTPITSSAVISSPMSFKLLEKADY